MAKFRPVNNIEAANGARRPTAWMWLTVPIAILIAVAVGGELLVEGLFRGDSIYLVAQAVGQDVVTLVAALPALVVGAFLAARGSERARMVWLGVLVYLVYTYVIYAFQVRFNSLFLVYVALLGCSLYALIGGLVTTQFEVVRSRFTGRTPIGLASIFLGAVAGLFYLAWLAETLPAVLSGVVPQGVLANGTPTGAVHVLDMAWILPAMLMTSLWLRRGMALGYVLAGVLLTFLALLAAAIVAMTVAMWVYGQPVAVGMVVVFGTVSAASLGMLIRYLGGMEKGRSGRDSVQKSRRQLGRSTRSSR